MLIASSLSDLTDPNPTGVDTPWLRSRIEVGAVRRFRYFPPAAALPQKHHFRPPLQTRSGAGHNSRGQALEV